MRRLLLAASLALSTAAAGAASSQLPRVATPPPQVGAHSLSPAASDAAQVVNEFMAALAGGQLEAARRLMAPEAVVVANGNVLGNRDGYIDGAAKADAAALRTVERELLRRDAKAGGDFAWVLSEKRLLGPAGAQGPSEVVTETMLLSRTPAGWKITHIHWSGRHG